MSGSLGPIEENDLRDLTDQILRGKCILFIGSGVSVEAGLPSAWDIGIRLAVDSNYRGKDPGNLPEVADYYEKRFDRAGLLETLKNIFRGRAASADVTSYDLIAELGVFARIVTTNWDDLIEDAFRRKDISLEVIKSDTNLSALHGASHTLIKLHGDFSAPPETLIVTTQDYVRTYSGVNQAGGMFGLLAAWLETQTVLFVGYSLRDANFRYLFNLVKEHVPSAAVRHYAIMPDVDDYEKGAWERDNVHIIRMRARDFFVRLFNEVKEFANRDLEIEYICNQAKMPFVEVCGFAGCGKTRLLEQARKLYRLKEPIWSISLVDAAGADEFAVIARVSEDILGYKIVREQLVEQVRDAVEAKARREERFPSPDQITRAAAAQGAAQLANACRSRQAVLLFDNMERTFVRLLRWLEADLIPALWKEHFAPETKLRLVFAGRYPTCWNEWFVKNRLFQLPLSPFDEVVVSTMLRSSASIAIRTPLTREQNEHIVQRILWLSGGHPRAIRNLLQDLADQKFSVFLGDPDYFQQNRPELFDKHVFPVVKPILRDLSDETRTVLDSLSVFRRFNVGVLKALLDAEHPGAEKPPHEVQGELQQAHLVQPLDVTQPLYSLDHVVRYILAERLEIHEPERHTRLHGLAATLYDDLIAGIGGMPLDSQFLRTYMLESLFHHAILAQLKRETPEQMVFCFRDQVSKVAEKTSDAPAARTVLSQLHMLLEKDKELVCNLDAVIRREGYEEVLQIVDEGITGLAKAP